MEHDTLLGVGYIDDEETYSQPNHSRQHLYFWSCIAAICSSLVSICTLILGSHPPYLGHASVLPSRRASTYIGLEKVDFNQSPGFPPIVSFAHIVVQINNSDTKRKISEDHRGYNTFEGVVFPNDRHVVISAKVSTIIQFRHLDYGMERCVMHIEVPPSRETRIVPTSNAIVEVWELDTDGEISRFVKSSWTSAPPRRRLHGIVSLHDNATASLSEFVCSSGGFSTFELSCSMHQKDCSVDFWQIKELSPGIYMEQLDSIH